MRIGRKQIKTENQSTTTYTELAYIMHIEFHIVDGIRVALSVYLWYKMHPIATLITVTITLTNAIHWKCSLNAYQCSSWLDTAIFHLILSYIQSR